MVDAARGGGTSCSAGNSDTPSSPANDTPAKDTPSSIFPVIASCSTTSNTTERKPQKEEKKRGWLPSLRIWGASVNPLTFDKAGRPDRSAVKRLAEQHEGTQTLN